MSKVVVFECKKCGYCCRNLLKDLGGFVNGLFLTPKKARLFPSNVISPQRANGVKRPKHIISYQLNVKVCPYIDDENECMIYDKRPLTCKSYPNEPYPHGNMISVECKSVGSQMKDGEFCEVDISATEMEAGDKLLRYLSTCLRKYCKRNSKLWTYDLRTRKWVMKKPTKLKLPPFERKFLI